MLLAPRLALLLRARPWWTLLALAVLAAPWLLLVAQRNPGFLQFFFLHEQFERFLTRVHERYQPDWFFVPVLLLGFMPWTPLLPAIARRGWRAVRHGGGPDLLLALWVLFCFVFFSLSQSKLAPYILPLFPALAPAGRRHRWRRWMPASCAGGCASAPRSGLPWPWRHWLLTGGRLYLDHPELADRPGRADR